MDEDRSTRPNDPGGPVRGAPLEWSPDERESLDRLPRERRPSDGLEDRVVAGLRAEGLLADARGARPGLRVAGSEPPARIRRRRRQLRRGRGWAAVALAASVLVAFTGGLGVGRSLGVRSATDAFLAVRAQDATEAASQVQRAGSAYVSALASLGALDDGAPSPALLQGREVALVALYAATEELRRISPDDASLARAVEALGEALAGEGGAADAGGRNVVWF